MRGTKRTMMHDLQKDYVIEISPDVVDKIRSKFTSNYFGLPPYALQQSPNALAYQCRKARQPDEIEPSDSTGSPTPGSEPPDASNRKTISLVSEKSEEINFTAQRKVASALLTMVSNSLMLKHFLYKGGYDAVLRLIGESKDREVLGYCSQCLIQITSNEDLCKYLVEKGICNAIVTLLENPDDSIKHSAAVIITKLSYAPDVEDLLIMNNILGNIQVLLQQAHRIESMCFLTMSLCNLSVVIVGNDAETTVRMIFQASKKMDLTKFPSGAVFLATLYCNLSRISTFTSLLVDEGLLPFLLHLLDTQPHDEVISRTTETLANMSINRKNRREISSSGIASRLPMLFERGSPATKASALLIMGNLLSSGLFHDKVATPSTTSFILENLLDKREPKQFNAVSYCLCQLSKNDVSCAVLVQCSVIPIVLGFLGDAPKDSVDYLWTVLVNISQLPQFFQALVQHSGLLLEALHEEVKYELSSKHQRWAVAMISYSLSRESTFHTFLNSYLMEMFVTSMKTLFGARDTENNVQLATIAVLINFALHCVEARSTILGTDLIDLFYSVGVDDDRLNVRYVALLSLISNEENCCYRLLELGAHKLLVSLQDTFQRLIAGSTSTRRKKEKQYVKGQSLADLNQFLNGSSRNLRHSDSAQKLDHTDVFSASPDEYDAVSEGELGKELTAAILHNLALKRPVLAPGVLSMLLSLSKNCMSIRVLHCTRALAMMSVHSKSKVALSKESRRIIPMLTVCMRSGCAEAEKVQHYASIVLCNTLALTLDKALLQELVKDRGAVEDLVVVTLLRINETTTKEILGKTFFNLLGRPEVREILILQRDMLSAILELSKIQYSDLLELCMRSVYNISCELKPAATGTGVETVYAAKLLALKVPTMVVSRLVYSRDNPMPGSMTTRSVRLLLGMTLANLTFQKSLVLDLLQMRGVKPMDSHHLGHSHSETKSTTATPSVPSVLGDFLASATVSHPVADALYRVYVLGSEETTYCSVVSLYNLSRVPECRVLAATKALDLVNEVLRQESSSILVRQLSASFICNVSLMAEFHEQLTQTSVKNLVTLLGAPHIAMSLKMDALQAVYNLVALHPPSKSVFVSCELIASLWKLLKVTSGGGGGATATASADPTKEAASVASHNSGASGSFSTAHAADATMGTEEDEDRLHLLVAHIVKELCEDGAQDVVQLRQMMQDGVMSIVLKLSKIERVELKIDMSFSLYYLTRGQENNKVLKRDAVDILFWLTLQDMMSAQDLILRHVSRAMRSFSTGAEECRLLLQQERFFNVLKVLSLSQHEDVLWQTAGMLYNLMQVESCRKRLLERGQLIATIFTLASSGFDHVKHVCSACLHLVPDALPNIDDPMALDLVLCLLEAQGDKFSEISEKPLDALSYPLPSIHRDSGVKHVWSSFVSSWAPFTCLVDTAFTPASLAADSISFPVAIPMVTADPSSISQTEKHQKLKESSFEFGASARDMPPSAASAAAAASSAQASPSNRQSSVRVIDPQLPADEHAAAVADLTIQVPPAVTIAPPGYNDALRDSPQSRQSSRQKSPTHQRGSPKSSSSQKRRQKYSAHDQYQSMLLTKSTMSLSSSQKVSLPLIKPPAKVPADTLEAIRQNTAGTSQPTSSKSGRLVQSASATSLPDFSGSSFSYHPVMKRNDST